ALSPNGQGAAVSRARAVVARAAAGWQAGRSGRPTGSWLLASRRRSAEARPRPARGVQTDGSQCGSLRGSRLPSTPFRLGLQLARLRVAVEERSQAGVYERHHQHQVILDHAPTDPSALAISPDGTATRTTSAAEASPPP